MSRPWLGYSCSRRAFSGGQGRARLAPQLNANDVRQMSHRMACWPLIVLCLSACTQRSPELVLPQSDLDQLVLVVGYDADLDSLDLRTMRLELEEDRGPLFLRAVDSLNVGGRTRFLVSAGDPVPVGATGETLVEVRDVIDHGGVGSYLSLWAVERNQLRLKRVYPQRFVSRFGVSRWFAPIQVDSGLVVLSEWFSADGGSAWGGLRLHRVHERSMVVCFEKAWSAQNYAFGNAADTLYQYSHLPTQSDEYEIAVLEKALVSRHPQEELELVGEEQIRIPVCQSGT